jgi:hypothetical protein
VSADPFWFMLVVVVLFIVLGMVLCVLFVVLFWCSLLSGCFVFCLLPLLWR